MQDRGAFITDLLNRVFDDVSGAIEKTLGTTGRDILIGSSQAELRQAILADICDIVPIAGDISNILRVQDAARKGGEFPKKRIPTQLLDLLVGAVPGPVGDIADAVTPTNTINWLEAKGVSPTNIREIFGILKSEFATIRSNPGKTRDISEGYRILGRHLATGIVWETKDGFVGRAADGREVSIGYTKGDAAKYLYDHPYPEQW
ncbi:MAG: hypothetical protein ABIH46_12185 [Chloroflexota bacterium]